MTAPDPTPASHLAATQNACKMCAPLGASLAIRGIEGAVPLLHGSQGCATYIRRYMISHYREPLDIASSSFDESAAVFGGERNLIAAVNNIVSKYQPKVVGIATTCLAETMGEDVGMYIKGAKHNGKLGECPVFQVSTPSYKGTHVDGYFSAVYSVVETFAAGKSRGNHIAMLPGMLSPADIRHLKEIVAEFGLECDTVPDYSDTLDGPIWTEYQAIPEGGTPLSAIERLGDARAALELSQFVSADKSAAGLLQAKFGVQKYTLPIPIGVHATDKLFHLLSSLSECDVPAKHQAERGRLLDALVDGHKAVFGKRAVVFGDPDLVVGISAFLAEVGIHPIIVGTGTKFGRLQSMLHAAIQDDLFRPETVIENTDYVYLEELATAAQADILIGSSKGYGMSKRLNIPLIRVGFPIHDRIGGSRLLHIGYRGAQQLFDIIANTLIGHRQDSDDIGYAYM